MIDSDTHLESVFTKGELKTEAENNVAFMDLTGNDDMLTTETWITSDGSSK
jgi:hypothetical protein